MVLLYFFTTMLTIMLSSTIGTVLLVRVALQGHLRRSLARFSLLVLALGLPLAVPLAVAAIFTQVLHSLPWGGRMSMQDAAWLNLALFGAMAAGLVLSGFACINGWRRLRPPA